MASPSATLPRNAFSPLCLLPTSICCNVKTSGECAITVLSFPIPKDAAAFDPSTIRILSDALEDAWSSLQNSGTTFHIDGSAEQTREFLARCIIERAKLGERDRRRLRDFAVIQLAQANVRKRREL